MPAASNNRKMASTFPKVQFIGRDEELSALQDKLDSGTQLIQITGMSMVGKTELARRLGQAWKRSSGNKNGIYHVHEVSLRHVRNIQQVIFQLSVIFAQSKSDPVTPGGDLSQLRLDEGRVQFDQSHDGGAHWSEFGNSQPMVPSHQDSNTGPLNPALIGQQGNHQQVSGQYEVSLHSLMKTVKNLQEYYFIILDNAEDVSSANTSSKMQTDFMELCKGIIEIDSGYVHLIITTRVKFTFFFKQPLEHTCELKPLVRKDAEELLESVAPGMIDRKHRKGIAAMCGGLPKPLIMAGAAIRDGDYTAEQFCTEVDGGVFFEEQPVAVIRASVDKLSGILKEHSAELEYIPGSFGAELAAAVTGKATTGFVKQDVLRPLARRWLVDGFVDGMLETKRYDLHPFVRLVIRDHFSHLRDEHLVRDGFCGFFARLLDEMSAKIDRDGRNTLPLLSVEVRNIEKFLSEAMHCRPDRYRAIMEAAKHGEYILIDFLSTSGSVEFYTACVNSARMNGNDVDCAVMLHCYGQALNQIRGNWQEAYESYKEAIELLKPLGDSERLARLYSSVGWNLHMQGEERKALRYFHIALDMQKRLKMIPHKDTAATMSRMAIVYTYVGEYDKAYIHHTESYEIKGKIFGDHPTLGASQNCLGLYYNQIGDGDKAFKQFKLGLATKKRFNKNPTNDVVISLNNVAMEYGKRGNVKKALVMLDEAYEMREAMGLEHHDTSLIFNNRAKLYAGVHDYEKSEECFRRALQIRRKRLGTHTSTAGTLQQMGEVLLRANKLQEAKEAFSEAAELRQVVLAQQPTNDGIAESLSCLAETYRRMGDGENAAVTRQKSLQEFSRVKELLEKLNQHSRVVLVERKIEKLEEQF